MKDDECNYSHSKNEPNESSAPTMYPTKSVSDTSATGFEVSQPSAIDGYSLSTQDDLPPSNKDLERRMVRIESRLVQLMLFLGANPYQHKEETNG